VWELQTHWAEVDARTPSRPPSGVQETLKTPHHFFIPAQFTEFNKLTWADKQRHTNKVCGLNFIFLILLPGFKRLSKLHTTFSSLPNTLTLNPT